MIHTYWSSIFHQDDKFVALPYAPSNKAAQYSVEAVLASSDFRMPFIAQSLEIQAQTTDMVGNVQAWRTLNAGDNQCSNRASVGTLEVLDRSQRIKTHFEVKSGTEDNLLCLVSVGV